MGELKILNKKALELKKDSIYLHEESPNDVGPWGEANPGEGTVSVGVSVKF